MTPVPQKEYIITEEQLSKLFWEDTDTSILNTIRSRPYTSAPSNKVLEEVYEKFKHLDKPLTELTTPDGDFGYWVARELWRAIKEHRQEPKR